MKEGTEYKIMFQRDSVLFTENIEERRETG
jgi:hypothetical protein